MFGALGTMLPLVLVGFVIWYFVRRSRKASAALPPDQRLKGVRGWLAFYIVASSIFGPLVTSGRLAQELQKVVSANPAVQELPAWSTYVNVEWTTVALYVAWVWWVNYGLCKRFEPSSVRRVKVFLLGSPLVLAAVECVAGYALFDVNGIADIASGTLKTVVPTLIWFGYFSVSKRVRATYFGDFPAATTQPAPSQPIATPPAPLGSAVVTSTAASPLEQKLAELARLLDRGLVSQSDYDAKKAELLGTL